MLALILLVLGACGEEAGEDAPDQAGHVEAASAPTNRVEVPAAVRQNLGITFAGVERRAVARTIRSPGRFELLPSARREYHAPLDGRVELLVEQMERVDAGTPLYRLDSREWRQLQLEIADAEAAVLRAEAERESSGPLLEAHARHRESLEESVELWGARVAQLEEIREAGGGRASDWAQAQASLTDARAGLADVVEQTAELDARRVQVVAELSAARAKMELLLASAATLLGVTREELLIEGADGPLWRTASVLEVRAAAAGIVEELGATNGGWVEEKGAVLTTVQPSMVRFRARGLQSDLLRVRDGLPARVAPPPGGSLGPAEVMEGTLAIGLSADADERTVDLLVTPRKAAEWARAGVSGFLEVDAEGAGGEELAIPLRAVIRDGLTAVVFRRDPRDPDRVIRLEADLGIDDGRWVVVKSGLREGDEVVLDGVYQLMLATSGTAQRGGHFHSDGTFHEGEDE
jgi:multidrug efflux pump subunit AcrA (membrane-fusion protein)